MSACIESERWSQLSEVIERTLGLSFPRERWDDLERGIAETARELRFQDAAECVSALLSSPTHSQLRVLASHLTVGETYFYRDPQTMEALATGVLPELIARRRGRGQRLRIWSAACSTGEEPYSIAMLVHRLLPDLSEWHVTITATDVNPLALQKAAGATYREWSFRAAPAYLKECYFESAPEGCFQVIPEVRRLVTFEPLNLASDVYPSRETGVSSMDLIFCRNALMYFTAAQVARVIPRLHDTLVEGGWLVVGASEVSQARFHRFAAVNVEGATLYRRRDALPHDSPELAE